MDQKVFRVGVIGCGTIAKMHANALLEGERTVLVACADIIKERAIAFSKTYQCKAYDSAKEMIACEALDAVHICTPHATHFPLVQLATSENLAVFTEKPPVVTKQELEQFLLLGEKHRIGVCFQNRYNDAVVAAKARLAAGEFGALLGARGFVTWQREESYYQAAPWRGILKEAMGGCLINQSIHTLDLILTFLGAPEKVTAQTTQLKMDGITEVEDTLHALLQYQDGKRGVFYATNCYCKDERVFIELACEKAVVRIEEEFLEIRPVDGAREVISFAGEAAEGKAYWGTSHARCIADFYRAYAENDTFANEPRSVKTIMETVLEIYENGHLSGVSIK